MKNKPSQARFDEYQNMLPDASFIEHKNTLSQAIENDIEEIELKDHKYISSKKLKKIIAYELKKTKDQDMMIGSDISSNVTSENLKKELRSMIIENISDVNSSQLQKLHTETTSYTISILEGSPLDKKILNRLYLLDEGMSEHTFQLLIMASYILSKHNIEEGIRKIIYHVEFCKQNRESLQLATNGLNSISKFDINEINQQRFQRILYTCGIKDRLQFDFLSTLYRANNIGEEKHASIANVGYIFDEYSGFFKDKTKSKISNESITLSEKRTIRDKAKKQSDDIYFSLIEVIIQLIDSNPEFLKIGIEQAWLSMQHSMEKEYSKMNFKEKTKVNQLLFDILSAGKFSNQQLSQRKGNEEAFWNHILPNRKPISFNGEVLLSQTGPALLCYFEHLNDLKKTIPRAFKKEITNKVGGLVYNFPLAKKGGKFKNMIICTVGENNEDEQSMQRLISHELFHIYQNHVAPHFKTISNLDYTQFKIKHELVARVSEEQSLSDDSLYESAKHTLDIVLQRELMKKIKKHSADSKNSKIGSEGQEKKYEEYLSWIHEQIKAIKRITERNGPTKSAFLLHLYTFRDRGKIPQ